MSITRSRRRSVATIFAALALAPVALLAGCAGQPGSDRPGATHSTGSGSGGDGLGNATYEQELATWTDRFDACMRKQGIDLPKRDPGKLLDLDSLGIDAGTYKTASGVCTKRVGPAPVDPDVPTEDEYYKMELAFASCMREAGYEWEDPAPPSAKGGAAGAKPIDPDKYDPKDLDACAAKAGFTAGGARG